MSPAEIPELSIVLPCLNEAETLGCAGVVCPFSKMETLQREGGGAAAETPQPVFS